MNCNNIIRENYLSDLCLRNSLGEQRQEAWNCKGKKVPQRDPQGRYITQQRARQLCEHNYYQWNWWDGWRVCDGTPTSNEGKGWSCQMGTGCRPPE